MACICGSSVAGSFTRSIVSYLFAGWMEGFPLNVCLSDYAEKMDEHNFDDHDSYRISGAYDLFRSAQ